MISGRPAGGLEDAVMADGASAEGHSTNPTLVLRRTESGNVRAQALGMIGQMDENGGAVLGGPVPVHEATVSMSDVKPEVAQLLQSSSSTAAYPRGYDSFKSTLVGNEGPGGSAEKAVIAESHDEEALPTLMLRRSPSGNVRAQALEFDEGTATVGEGSGSVSARLLDEMKVEMRHVKPDIAQMLRPGTYPEGYAHFADVRLNGGSEKGVLAWDGTDPEVPPLMLRRSTSGNVRVQSLVPQAGMQSSGGASLSVAVTPDEQKVFMADVRPDIAQRLQPSTGTASRDDVDRLARGVGDLGVDDASSTALGDSEATAR